MQNRRVKWNGNNLDEVKELVGELSTDVFVSNKILIIKDTDGWNVECGLGEFVCVNGENIVCQVDNSPNRKNVPPQAQPKNTRKSIAR